MSSDHSSIDVLKEEKKLRRQRWKKWRNRVPGDDQVGSRRAN